MKLLFSLKIPIRTLVSGVKHTFSKLDLCSSLYPRALHWSKAFTSFPRLRGESVRRRASDYSTAVNVNESLQRFRTEGNFDVGEIELQISYDLLGNYWEAEYVETSCSYGQELRL